MRVAIAGAGAVGRSVALELSENGHHVLLIDRAARSIRSDQVPSAQWLLADACEMSTLVEAQLQTCDVVIAATGDDKVNLVVSLLAKTEFAVPRTVARVNNPSNEWLFTEAWGVDVALSTPRLMSALVEEAFAVGDLVRLFTFGRSTTTLVELTIPDDSRLIGQRLHDVAWPKDVVATAVLRGPRVLAAAEVERLEAGDELVFIAAQDAEPDLARLLA